MRRILVDYARARLASKRGGGAHVMSLDELSEPSDPDEGPVTTPTALQHLDDHTQENVSAIDEALQRLERIDKQQAQIIEMRYFGKVGVRSASLRTSTRCRWTNEVSCREWVKRAASGCD
jgi:hypothetical protein